jgi:hypothetical protein
MDSPGFHSLSRLCRKSHVDALRDPPSDSEFMWQGGNKFNELLRALLEYLVSMEFVLPTSPPPIFPPFLFSSIYFPFMLSPPNANPRTCPRRG